MDRSEKNTTLRGQFGELDTQFLAACIRLGFYSGRVHDKSELAVRYGTLDSGRHVRNPLTRTDVVGNKELAETNSLTLLRRAFPNLDFITVSAPGFFIAATMLGLQRNIPLFKIRRTFVESGVLPGRLPENYFPPTAASAYFDARCVIEDLEDNRDKLIRRRWSTIDDPENDTYMAVALGVPNTVEALSRRASKTLRNVIPDSHSFKYNERLDSRYFNLDYVTAEERESNLRKAFKDTFGTLKEFTFAAATACAGIPRLARILGLKGESYLDIKQTIQTRGYLA